MANQLLTRQEITRESLMVLENELHVVKNFYRDLDQEFGKKGGKIGSTIFVRKPPRAIGRDGQQYQPEGMTDTEVPVAINQQSGVDFEFSSAEKYLSIDEFKERYLNPYMISLANKLDYRSALTAAQNTANAVGYSSGPGSGAPGTGSSDAFLIYRQAGQKLDEMGFPLEGGRTMVITPAMVTGWLDFAKGFFNPTAALASQWKKGQVSNALGYDWFTDQNLFTQTVGALQTSGTSVPIVSGASQTGTSLATSGWTNSTAILNVGDVFAINGVYAVNPQNRNSTGSLQQFVVQAAATSNGSGLATLSFMPAIVPSGQFQNVTQAPPNGNALTVYGIGTGSFGTIAGASSPQGLLFHKQAFAFVSFPGDVPEGVDMGYEDRSPEVGVSLRFVRIWDGYRDQWVNRFDVYYGIAPLYMEGACRIWS